MASKDNDILSAWAELFVAHALAVRAIEQEISKKAPLSLDEYDLLLTVSRSPGQEIRLSALAKATVYTKSGISRVLRRLEAQRYLKRKECPEDKRGAFAALTELGREAMKETWVHYRAAIIKTLEHTFTANEARTVRDLLKRLADDLSGETIIPLKDLRRH